MLSNCPQTSPAVTRQDSASGQWTAWTSPPPEFKAEQLGIFDERQAKLVKAMGLKTV
jgi:hypothetical protein